METLYDYVTVAAFIGIAVMYFHFNKDEDQNILAYMWPAIGCAISNYFGNEGFPEVSAIVFIGVIAWVWFRIWKKGGVPDTLSGED